jgi:hypothetical protein
MRLLSRLLVVAAIAVGAARASDAAVIFDFSRPCETNCASIGLAVGDPMSAWISFDDAAIAPDASVTAADILDFAIDFGTVEITRASAVGFYFTGELNPAADAFSSFFLSAGESLVPNFGDLAGFSNINFGAGQGFCIAADCSNTVYASGTFAGGDEGGTLTLREAQTVPEPGTLALLGVGLAGFVFARRRRVA